MTEKPKRKPKSARPYLSKEFEFVAPISLGKCHRQLRNVHNLPTRWYENVLWVRATPDGEDAYDFRMNRGAGRNLHVEALGRLERLDEHSTLVTGYARISATTRNVLMVLVVINLMVAVVFRFYELLVLAVPLYAILWIHAVKTRDGLVAVLHTTLGEDTT